MSALGITILKNNVPWGPFTRERIKDGLIRGDFTLQYLAHAPGLKEWLPLGEVIDYVERSVALPPVPASQDLPPVPPREEVAASKIQAPSVPPAVMTSPIQPADKLPPPVPPVVEKNLSHLIPASFVPRAIAFLIDGVILFMPISLLFVLGAILLEVQGAWEQIDHESRMQEWALLKRNSNQLLLLVAVGLGWLYAAGLECSRWQATIGKRWMGMKVTDSQGERIGFLRATGRHAAKYLSALPCFLGFIMALFSSRGRAFHDRLADTRVVKA